MHSRVPGRVKELRLKTSAKKKQTLGVKLGKKLRAPFDRLFERQSLVPNARFLDPALFTWGQALSDHWKEVQAELDSIMAERDSLPELSKVSPDHRRIAADGKWKSFFFKAYGYRVGPNARRCPKTAALIDSIPGVLVAFFSVMEPGIRVPRHRGLTKALLNVHLGLRIPGPPDQCGISVGGEVRGWEEGKVLVLDDTYHHEVWNKTDRPRAVLFLQIRRPVRPLGRLLGDAFLGVVRYTNYVQEGRRLLEA